MAQTLAQLIKGVNLASAPANSFTIDSSGRCGIGTTTVNRPLVVFNDSVAALSLNNTTTGTAGGDGFQIQLVGSDGYVFNYEAAPVIFGTASTERARIDSSGRLLVGTSTAPTVGNASVSKLVVQAYVGSSTGQGILSLQSGLSPTTAVNGDKIAEIGFNANNGSPFAEIAAFADDAPGTNDYPGRLVFSTTANGSNNPTERMRIDNSGLVHITPNTDSLLIRTATGAGTSNYIIAGNRNRSAGETTVFYVFTNGSVQNATGSYTTISDLKLKENIVDASSQWDDLKTIKIRNWNFKKETGHDTHRQIGPIAQELEAVCPGLVFETPDRDADGNETGEVTKGVNQSVLYMKAVKALQEAMERIEQLEAKVAALESA